MFISIFPSGEIHFGLARLNVGRFVRGRSRCPRRRYRNLSRFKNIISQIANKIKRVVDDSANLCTDQIHSLLPSQRPRVRACVKPECSFRAPRGLPAIACSSSVIHPALLHVARRLLSSAIFASSPLSLCQGDAPGPSCDLSCLRASIRPITLPAP